MIFFSKKCVISNLNIYRDYRDLYVISNIILLLQFVSISESLLNRSRFSLLQSYIKETTNMRANGRKKKTDRGIVPLARSSDNEENHCTKDCCNILWSLSEQVHLQGYFTLVINSNVIQFVRLGFFILIKFISRKIKFEIIFGRFYFFGRGGMGVTNLLSQF